MSTFQKIAFALVIIAMIVGIIVFWGSVFSVVLVFALIMSLPVYLYNRFINVDQESDFQNDGDI